MKAPKAPEARTYTLSEIIARAGITLRTARHYLSTGVVPRPRARGRGTVYTDEHLWRILAVRKLRLEGEGLDAIKARLATMPLDAVRALVEPPTATVAPSTTLSDISLERWERATLLPGLELLVRADAGPLVARIAREIVANYRAG